MPNVPGSKSRRRQLLVSTILAGGVLAAGGIAPSAYAQDISPIPVPVPAPVPVPPPVPVFVPVPAPAPFTSNKLLPDANAAQAKTSSGGDNSAPQFQLGPGVQLNVVLRDKGTIINWGGTGFNIGTGARVDFADGFSANPAGREAIAVLNRDVNTAGDRSVIAGSLTTSSNNISVYLLNRNGILFGPGATVNTGSFVASTLDLADDDFFDGGTNRFTGAGGAITVQGRANIRNSAANGALALLAGSVDIQRDAVVNANGDLAIAAASDVSLTMEPGSPLSMTIERGTTVANPLIVAGSVGGRNVYLAMATRDGVRDALLDITGTVTATTALVTDRGVVLAAGAGASAPGVTIAGPDTGGGAGIRIAGDVVARRAAGSPDAVANVEVAARGDVTGGGAITAANLLNVVGGRDVNLSGAMNAGTGARFSAARDVNVARATVEAGDLRFDAGATVRLDEARLTARNGDVLLLGATRLTRASTITAGGSGSVVSFGGTLDGPGSLATSSDAGARFDGAVGGGERLTSLTVGGLATLNAGTMRAGAIRLGALEVGTAAPADVTVDAGTGALTIDGAARAATADANRLTLRGGSIAVRDVGVGGGAGIGERFAAVTFIGDTTLTGDVAAAQTVRFADRFLLGAGIRRVNAASAEFGAVDAAGSGQATLSVTTAGASRFNAGVGGSRSIDLALRVGSTSFAATNRVGLLAAEVATGGFSFANGRTLTIGTVDGLTGVTADVGDVRIASTGSGGDLRLAAPVLASAGDLFLSAARDVTGATAATVTGSGRVELRATGGAIDLSGAVTAGGDIDAVAIARGRFGTLTADRDVRVVAGQGLTIAGAVAGRDIALRAEGDLIAGDLTARDDVVVRAGGSATLGRIVAGSGTDVDAPGAGDSLSATGTLIGGDVDVIAAGIRIGSVRASGAGSDIRLSGGTAGIGEAAVDLELSAGGSILLVGPVRGTDIALSASEGSVVANDVRARDDIAVRAGGAIRFANATSGVAVDGQAAIERDGAADALAGSLAGNDIDLAGGSVDIPAVTANGAGGDLRIMATGGDLRLGAGQAGGAAILTKQGSSGELQVTGSVRGGTASANGDVRLTSDTNARVASAASATGTVSVTATGEVTGVGASGRADLRSVANDTDVIVRAGLLARLGTATAGRDLSVSAGTVDLRTGDARDISLEAGGAVAVGTLRARDDVAIRAAGAVTGDVVLAGVDARADETGAADASVGTVLTGNDVDIRGASIALGRADANDRGAANDLRLAATTGDLALGSGAAGGVAMLGKTGAAGELRIIDALVANSDVRIESEGAARLSTVTSRTGAVSVTATGEATGGTLRADAGDVSVAGGQLVAFDTAFARDNLRVDAGSVRLGTGTAQRGDLTLRASTGRLTLGTGDAGGVATLITEASAGELQVTNGLVANGDVRIEAAGAARLPTVTSRTGAVSVTAAGDATGGTLRADAGDVSVVGGQLIAFDTLSANANVRADAGSVLVGSGVADRGDLTLRASTGRLTLGTGSAGGVATLNKAGADGELRVANSLVANGDARIDSAGAARLASVTSRTGAVSVTAAGEATGGTLRADAGDVSVAGGPLAAFDTVFARENLRAEAGSVRLGTGTAERGELRLGATVGQLTLGAGSAGGTATLFKLGGEGALQVTGTLTAGTAGAGGDVAIASEAQARIGEAVSRTGDVRVSAASEILGADGVGGATLRAGADIDVVGGTLARLGVAEAGRDVSVTADAVEVADSIGRDIALRSRAGPTVLGTVRARDDIVVRAAGPVTATALRAGGDGAVDENGVADALAERTLAGNDIDVRGASIDIGSVTATGAMSDLRLAATQGRLRLGEANVGGAVDLSADGPDGELELPGASTFAGDASFTTTRSFRFGAIASRLGTLRVTAGGDVIGDRLTSDAGDVFVDAGALASIGALVAARDGTVRGQSVQVGTGVVGRDLLLSARAGSLTLGRGDAGGGATLIKDGAAGDLVVTQAVAAGAGDAVLTSSTNIRAARAQSAGGGVLVQAANGDVVGIGDGRLDIAALGVGRDAAVRAAGVARLGAVTAARDVVVNAQNIDLISAAGRDIALDAGGAAIAGTLRARDDIAVRAGGALAIGDAAAGAGTPEDGDGAADALAGLALAGNDLDAQGGALSAATATAVGDVRLTALTGSLAAGSISGGGGVTLAKQGADGSLGATGPIAANGDIAIRSATDVRIAGATSAAGGIAVDAAREVRGGDLSAANGSVAVRAGSTLALNGVAAGNDVSAAADATDIGSASATRGSLTLLARAGDLSIGRAAAGAGVVLTKQGGTGELRATGAIDAGGDAALRSSTNIRVAGVTSRAGDLLVDAARDARGTRASASSGSATLRAGSTLAFDDIAAGAGISGAADTVAIGTAVAARGALDLSARAGDLSLGGGAAETGATLTKQGATGELRVSGALTVGGDVAVRSATDIRVAGVTSRAGNLLVDAARNARGDGLFAAGGSIAARAGSTLAFGAIAAGGGVSGAADAVEVGTATATRGALELLARAGDLSLGTGTAATGIGLTKQGATGELRVSGALAAGGDVAVRSATDIRVAGVTSRAGNLLVDATRNVRGDALSTPNGSITARAGSALAFETLAAGGNISGAADTVAIGAATATRGALDLLARGGDLSLGRGVAGTSATLTKQGAAGQLRVSGSLAANGDVNATSSTDARLANAASETGRLAVTAAGDVTGAALGAAANDGRAAPGFGGADLQAARGGVSVTAGGALAQLGTVTAGPALTIKSNDLELLGTTTADRVEIVNGGLRGGTRLGDDLPPGAGLNLRQAEIDRIAAGSLVVQSGARDMELGTLAFSARTGANAIALLTTGRIDVTGGVSAAGSPNAPLRGVRIGGDAADGLATTLRVASTSTGGGRLTFANTALDLRAARIGVGQDLLFLDTIGLAPGGAPLPVSAVTARYISNPSSTLYVAARPYALTDGQPVPLISASTLSLRFTDYVLVQNTAASAASPAGIAVGGPGVPSPFLTLNAGGESGANAIALFGTINGFGGQQAALLGPDFIALNGVNRANSRINGCPVGAGGEGCLAANVFTTTTAEPEEEDEVVITVADEQPLALDAPVGASNEALIIGVGAGDKQGRPNAPDKGDGDDESAGGTRPL